MLEDKTRENAGEYAPVDFSLVGSDWLRKKDQTLRLIICLLHVMRTNEPELVICLPASHHV